MAQILSTLTSDVLYIKHRMNGEVMERVGSGVLVNGGASIANPRTLITPNGVYTEVSDADLEYLESIDEFNKHVMGGYITVYAKKAPDVEKGVADMQRGDGSSPVTQDTVIDKYDVNGEITITVGGPNGTETVKRGEISEE